MVLKLGGGSNVSGRSPAVDALRSDLAAGVRDLSVLLLGDSTADAPEEWFYTAMQGLGAKFPTYTVRQLLWSDTLQTYSTTATIQTGTAGARVDGYADYTGTAGNYLSTPDTTGALTVTGDIDVRVRVALADWTPAALQALAAKFNFGGARAWRFYLDTASRLVFEWTTDGTTLITKVSTATLAAQPDGSNLWVRATLDVDNGATGNDVKFYTSPDGLIWTQLGATVTTAGVTSIFTTGYPLELGSRQLGANDVMTGRLYAAQVARGIDGPPVADLNLNSYMGTSTFSDFTGNTWAINGSLSLVQKTGAPVLTAYNGSASGRNIAYHADPTRFPKVAPVGRPIGLTFISHSHNENADVNGFAGRLKGLADQVTARYPTTGLCLMAQNPRKAPAPYLAEHVQRLAQARAIAARERWDYVDAYTPLAGDVATYVNTDGIHPTPAGSVVWARAVQDYLGV